MTNPKGLEINKNEVIAACTGRGCPGQCWSHRPWNCSKTCACGSWELVAFKCFFWLGRAVLMVGLDDQRII